ncbi:MoaE-domain-containing protein [Violaceomyces palustris]|uniref:MoaE-domain-containing protein n=1 Tax=Violaceomyces palustris TaxID=1673888 RepID=A0ACD0P3V3_9BASI|nr:MoaE-domain-containing protein [Violaceomyces palustris]
MQGPSDQHDFPSSSTAGELTSSLGDKACLTYQRLDEAQAIKEVADNGAGATVLFSGTTRDNFQGKVVTRLEYEAYSSLALKTMEKVLIQAHSPGWRTPSSSHIPYPVVDADSQADPSPDLVPAIQRHNPPTPSSGSSGSRISHIYISHRLGNVPVGESSILIAVSSPHRREAFMVAEWALEEVKKSVPIWKKEVYEGTTIDTVSQHDESQTESRDGGSCWKENFPPSASR